MFPSLSLPSYLLRLLREEQRWLREEQRWVREREALLQEISDLQLRIQTLELRNSNIAALLEVLKEKNQISESGSPMVLENTREADEEEEEEKSRVSEEDIEEVQAMQEALLRLGFYCGEEDMRLFMDQTTDGNVETASTTKQEVEADNGAVKTQVSEKQRSIIKDQGNRGTEVSQHTSGVPRWEDPSRLNKPINTSKYITDTKTKCITCRGEGRLMCLECDGTGEPNIEPQFMEWVDEDSKCMYCEGLGYTVCDCKTTT